MPCFLSSASAPTKKLKLELINHNVMMIRFNFLHFISEWIDHKDFVIIIAPLEKNLFVYPTLFLAATTKL